MEPPVSARPENQFSRLVNKIATPAGKPVWGSPEWHEEMRRIGRVGFIYGHMGAGGDDLDKKDWTDADENYECNPRQSGDR